MVNLDSETQIPNKLINDAQVSDYLSMSRSWIRKERYNRRHNLPHSLTIDPTMVGTSPRYRLSDIEEWMANLSKGN